MPSTGAMSIPEMEHEAGSDRPGVAADRDRAGALRGEQLRVVDQRLHRQADTAAAEEQRQPDRRQNGQRDDDDLAHQHLRAGDLDLLLRQVRRELQRDGAVAARQHRLQQHDQTDGGDDLHDRGCFLQPERDALQQQRAEQPDEEQREPERDRPRQARVDPEGVEDVGRRSRLRADREVEDARGLERQHQAEGGEGVDRAVGDAGQHERPHVAGLGDRCTDHQDEDRAGDPAPGVAEAPGQVLDGGHGAHTPHGVRPACSCAGSRGRGPLPVGDHRAVEAVVEAFGPGEGVDVHDDGAPHRRRVGAEQRPAPVTARRGVRAGTTGPARRRSGPGPEQQR